MDPTYVHDSYVTSIRKNSTRLPGAHQYTPIEVEDSSDEEEPASDDTDAQQMDESGEEDNQDEDQAMVEESNVDTDDNSSQSSEGKNSTDAKSSSSSSESSTDLAIAKAALSLATAKQNATQVSLDEEDIPSQPPDDHPNHPLTGPPSPGEGDY